MINLSAGMGGDLVLGNEEAPLPLDPDGTDMAGAAERLAHVEELMPEICTLDCGSMNFAAGGDYVLVNTPGIVRAMARRIQALGVRPELEVFDSGHLVLVKELIGEGLIDDPGADPALHGHPVRRSGRPATLMTMVGQLPAGCVFSAFSIGRCSSRMSPWRRWRAATCGWGWRTTSTSRAACWRPTASSSSGP